MHILHNILCCWERVLPDFFFLFPSYRQGEISYELHKPLGIRLRALNIVFHKLLSHFDVCWLFLPSAPPQFGKLESEALFPSWPGCYSAIAHTSRLLTYGQRAQPKFWEAQPLAASSTLSCLYIQEMKSECWYKTGWVENWEAGRTEVGDWEGEVWGDGERQGLVAVCIALQHVWVGGFLLCASVLHLIALATSESEDWYFMLADRYMHLSSGVWKDQHAEIVLSWSCGSICARAWKGWKLKLWQRACISISGTWDSLTFWLFSWRMTPLLNFYGMMSF